MDRVVPEIMHVGDLNVGKQIDKQGVMRHADTYARDRISIFYADMGSPRNTKKKSNGRLGEDWLKASQFYEMIYGCKRFPGGAPAWVPSLVLLLGVCCLSSIQGVRIRSRRKKTDSVITAAIGARVSRD
eukprot:6181512-Pleurochrysis_carterae.AAC.3